jgi:hypothetical protein
MTPGCRLPKRFEHARAHQVGGTIDESCAAQVLDETRRGATAHRGDFELRLKKGRDGLVRSPDRRLAQRGPQVRGFHSADQTPPVRVSLGEARHGQVRQGIQADREHLGRVFCERVVEHREHGERGLMVGSKLADKGLATRRERVRTGGRRKIAQVRGLGGHLRQERDDGGREPSRPREQPRGVPRRYLRPRTDRRLVERLQIDMQRLFGQSVWRDRAPCEQHVAPR